MFSARKLQVDPNKEVVDVKKRRKKRDIEDFLPDKYRSDSFEDEYYETYTFADGS